MVPRLSLVLAVAALAASLPAQAAARKLDLAVGYAGAPDAARTAAWMEFLGAHFREAKALPLADLSMQTAAPFDVVIVDGPPAVVEGGRIHLPKVPSLDRSFTKPVVLVGAAAGTLLGHVHIKLDWL